MKSTKNKTKNTKSKNTITTITLALLLILSSFLVFSNLSITTVDALEDYDDVWGSGGLSSLIRCSELTGQKGSARCNHEHQKPSPSIRQHLQHRDRPPWLVYPSVRG